MSEPTQFGALLKAHLYARGKTQEWLAREVGIEPASLSRAMGGGRRPSAELILVISAKLELSIREQQQLLSSSGYGQATGGGGTFGSGFSMGSLGRFLGKAQQQPDNSLTPGGAESDDTETDDRDESDLSATPRSLGALVDRIVDDAHLTDEQRAWAERLILESARAISRTLSGGQPG